MINIEELKSEFKSKGIPVWKRLWEQAEEDAKTYNEDNFVSEMFRNIYEYRYIIEVHAKMVALAYIREQDGEISEEECKDLVVRWDTRRKTAHDAAMASIPPLNRMAASMGLEPLCPDFQYRDQYGDWICQVFAPVMEEECADYVRKQNDLRR